MSLGQTFFDHGKMYMHFKCMKCKKKNRVCINDMLATKGPPKCGKCKHALIDQLDVDDVLAKIHPDELTPQAPPAIDQPPDVWDGVDPYAGDDEEEEEWVI